MGSLKKKNNKNYLLPEFIVQFQHKGNRIYTEKCFLKVLRGLKKESIICTTTDIFLNKVVSRVKPYVGTRRKKVGSVLHSIPVSISPSKEISMGIYWIISESCGYKIGPLNKCIKQEFLAIGQRQARCMQKKEILYRLVTKNRAYIKYLYRYR